MKQIANSSFNRLLGTWKTTGTVKTSGEDIQIEGIDTYELILDGHYILHKANVQMGPDRSQTYEMIGLQDDGDNADMYFFNANGEKGVMQAKIIGDAFTIESNELSFNGKINTANTLILGKWFRLINAKSQTEFIDLRLEKVDDRDNLKH